MKERERKTERGRGGGEGERKRRRVLTAAHIDVGRSLTFGLILLVVMNKLSSHWPSGQEGAACPVGSGAGGGLKGGLKAASGLRPGTWSGYQMGSEGTRVMADDVFNS